MTIDWQGAKDLIARNDSFLLTSHCRADCDAVGSELGLAHILESLGKQATIVNGDPVPEHIRFLDPERRVKVIHENIEPKDLAKIDAVIILDTSAWVQLGPMADVVREYPGERLLIDHHVSEDDMKAIVFKDSAAEATGRLVLELGESLGVEITPEIATPLFAAIATDTGWFRFASVTAKTFQALSTLVLSGASPPAIFSSLFEQHNLKRIKLRARIFDHIVGELDNRLMWTYVGQQDFDDTGANKTDTEDAINTLLTVKGSEVAVLFVEINHAKTKVSLRSRTEFDVRSIAEQFGGGGHRAAAGITYPGDLATAQTAVLDALRAALR